MGTEQGYVECDRTESCFIIVCIIIMKISAFLRHKTIHAKIVDRASCTKPAQEKLTERRKACGMVQLWEKMGTADFQILLTKWTKANKILPPVDRVSKLEQWHISLPHQ
jgi:hypothetical protein